MRDNLDRFYTKEEEARRLLKEIDLDFYDLKIEPSAGSGSFSNLVDGSLAFDIGPTGENIIKQDFLDLQVDKLPEFNKMLIFGNPPFGKRSSLAKDFIKHSISLGATTIAFILPKIFNKRLNQTMFPANWRLIKIVDLNDSNFILDNEEIFIPCSFYVWTKDEAIEPGVNLRQVKPKVPTEFSIVNRGSKDAHFSLNGNNGKIKEIVDITNPKAEHYVRVNSATGFMIEPTIDEINKVKEMLGKLEFDFYSSVNGGVAWVNREDIYRAWNNLNQ